MALSAGALFGAYEVTAQIGAGGMGEVYRARDRVLSRDVALKVLPDSFAADAERLARFKREAQVLASLNHPYIAAIYGFVESNGAQALVLELVEGATLADILSGAGAASRALSIEEALAMARQIAIAVEAAHEQGIVHRDLKPANIKVREDGTVKVLDFGLAKAIDSTPGSRLQASGLSQSPTITTPAMTGMGVILGTAAYMSPEQAKGREADQRSDVWSFGCVLYEMLTGKRAFEGEDVSDTLAAVLRGEPDWTALPAATPPSIRALLRRCLEKDRRTRIASISTALFAIDERTTGLSTAGVPISGAASHPMWRRAVPFAATIVATSALVGALAWTLRPSAPSPPITRFSFTLPEGQQFTNGGRPLTALSPDGAQLVYIANRALYLRAMSDTKTTMIQGSQDPEGVTTPTFSPDGQSIVFMSASDRLLKKLAVKGGVAVPVCPVAGISFGVSWTSDGITFAQGGQVASSILRVSPDGGKPAPIATFNADDTVFGPHVLPGGKAVLFTLVSGLARATVENNAEAWDSARVVVQSIESGERKTVIDGGSAARYLPTGHIVYAVGGVLMAVPFDADRLEITGSAVPVIEGIARGGNSGAAQFTTSATGSLAYVPGPTSTRQRILAFLNRDGGSVEPLNVEARPYESVRVSPDGKWIAAGTNDSKNAQIWIHDLGGTAVMRLLTTGGGRSRFPTWAPDSQRVAFQSDRNGDLAIFSQRADGSSIAERLTKPAQGAAHIPWSWSADGNTLLYTTTQNSGTTIAALSLAERKPASGLSQLSTAGGAEFSPDGRWIVYTLMKGYYNAGIAVEPFPSSGIQYEIGGFLPSWSPNGKELLFVSGGSLMSIGVTTQPTFTFGVRTPTGSEVARFFQSGSRRSYDIMPDGKRLVLIVAQDEADDAARGSSEIHVVLNWFEELKRLAPR